METLILREMTLADLPLFKSWLFAPHVARWYHEPEDWIEEIEKQADEYKWLHHYIALHKGAPLGFCQFYAAKDSDEDWFKGIPAEGTYSIDYLIGDPSALGKGLGKELVGALEREVLSLPDAARLAAQPEKENAASCALLRACGFAADDKGVYVKELKK